MKSVKEAIKRHYSESEITTKELEEWIEDEEVSELVALVYMEMEKPWNIFLPIAKVAYMLLTAMLRERECLCSYDPDFANQEEWLEAVEKMKFAFEYLLDQEALYSKYTYSVENNEKVKEGLELFGKYFRSLWD